MIKKSLLWGVYLFFVGALIWAGINRTAATLNNADGSQNHGSENSGSQHMGESSIATWEIYHGTLTDLDPRGITVTLENGGLLSLKPRPWRYAQQQGFRATLGDSLLVTAMQEGDKLEIAHLRNLDNESTAQLRDQNGHPLWNADN